jgi:hypothetical protein
MKAGDIKRWDFQSDIYGGRYRLIEKVAGKPGTWVIERLGPDEQTIDAIVAHYLNVEANGWMTTPIWDKTWAECDQAAGERPQQTGWTTPEQDMMDELARYEAQAGERTTIKFVSHQEWARHF